MLIDTTPDDLDVEAAAAQLATIEAQIRAAEAADPQLRASQPLDVSRMVGLTPIPVEDLAAAGRTSAHLALVCSVMMLGATDTELARRAGRVDPTRQFVFETISRHTSDIADYDIPSWPSGQRGRPILYGMATAVLLLCTRNPAPTATDDQLRAAWAAHHAAAERILSELLRP